MPPTHPTLHIDAWQVHITGRILDNTLTGFDGFQLCAEYAPCLNPVGRPLAENFAERSPFDSSTAGCNKDISFLLYALPLTMLDRYDKPITYSHTSRNRKKWIYALALFLGTLLLVHIYTTQEEWEERLQYAAKWNPAQGPRRKTSTIWNQRAESVRSAFAGAYEHYRRSAFPADELKPLTNQPVNK